VLLTSENLFSFRLLYRIMVLWEEGAEPPHHIQCLDWMEKGLYKDGLQLCQYTVQLVVILNMSWK
jgi:hypothetical protein